MVKRNTFDLNHQIHMCGEIGRLQTLGVIPVTAGDSLDINLVGGARLAPTRKEIVQDAKLDIFVFFRPSRHTYQDDWVNLVKDGPDATNNLTTVSRTADGQAIEYLGLPQDSSNIRRDLLNGYWDIYNWYFKNPDVADTSLTKIPTDDKERQYGTLISRLPHPMTRPRTLDGDETDLTDSDFEYQTASGIVDVRELAQVQAEAKSEIESNWYATRYPDIMKARYGATVSAETDERPTLIWRHSEWLSGQDINGMDDATSGQIQGKTAKAIKLHIPRKRFSEHGLVWIMCAVRFPTVHAFEQHYQLINNPSYDRDIGDPDILMQEPPQTFNIENYIANGSNFAGAQEPAAQHYRYQPSRIHTNFRQIPGYPFLKKAWASVDECYNHQSGDYDEIFQTWQLGHWSLSLLGDCQKLTVIPDVDTSIKVGGKT